MLKKSPILTAFLALVLTGLLHGRITNRWGRSDNLEAAVGKLEHLPLSAGDWDGTLLELNTDPAATKGMGAYVGARFVNRLTGDAMSITLICGRAGPLSLHPPTICLPSHGHTQKSPLVKTQVPWKGCRQAAEFMVADFGRPVGSLEEGVHVYWSYSHNGDWVVPENPRVTWARERAVFKLYVARPSMRADSPLEEDPTLPFVRAYLPELEKVLFGP
jgi:hypothetical protein